MAEHSLALRDGGDRRKEERRPHSRGGADRRQTQRRRQWLGRALLASLTIGVPAPANPAKLGPLSSPGPYDDLIIEAAMTFGLDPRLIRSVVQVESAFNHKAVSRAGAKGLMQLRPTLARELRVHNPFDPRENIMGGSRYLRRMLDLHEGDIRLALASDNAGPGSVSRYGGVPPLQETQNYIKRIFDLLEQGPQS